MKKSQLDELIRLITRKVLREFMNIDPTSNSSIHSSSTSTAPNAGSKESDASKAEDDVDPIDHKHDVEKSLKDLDFQRKAKEADYTRNQKMVTQYRQVERPAIMKQRQDLQKQLRSI